MEPKKTYSLLQLQASSLIHPGEVLKDELESRGVSQRRFATVTGIAYSVLNEIVNCKRAVSAEYALKIEAALGIPADFWLNMQNVYNMQSAKQKPGFSKLLESIRVSAAIL